MLLGQPAVCRHAKDGHAAVAANPPEAAPPLLEALAACHRALAAATLVPAGEQDLQKAEAWLSALLADVRAQLAGTGGSATALAAPVCQADVEESPDALDEWYTDPWANAGREEPKPAHRASASRAHAVAQPASQRGAGTPKSFASVQVFCLGDGEDAATEVEGSVARLDELAEFAGQIDEDADPHWQYGRCVATKLVEMSPLGSTAFEQLLLVLLALFDLTPEQQRLALRSRRKALRSQKSSPRGLGFRCLRGITASRHDEGQGLLAS